MKLITIHSLRGGAGRTTLALRKARDAGPGTVLIETDLTGTSLVDLLPLCAPAFDSAPEVPIDLDQVPKGWLSTWETTARIDLRHRLALQGAGKSWGGPLPVGVPFLNDYLLFNPDKRAYDDAEPRALFWIGDEGLPIIPASPLPHDQLATEMLLSSEDYGAFVEGRLERLVAALHVAGRSTVVFDIGRGLRGAAGAVLSLALRLALKRPLAIDGVLAEPLERTPIEVEILLLTFGDRRAIDRWLARCTEEERALVRVLTRDT